MSTAFDRRSFLAATTAAGSAAIATSAFAAESASASGTRGDKLRVAVLGVNGRGKSHIESFENNSNTTVALLCDPDRKVLAARSKEFQDRYGRKVLTEPDLRKVMDRKDIDIVSIAAPNHWHALATLWACQAGKDVYCEKPASHNLYEGRKLVEAVNKYNRIVQHGVQLRSNPKLQEAVEHLRKGTIGEVYAARAIVYRWRPTVGKLPDSAVPQGLDWDLWQGPAQERPFSNRYVHYNWHWHWEYGNGDIANQGVHETDMALWGMGLGLPNRVTAMGGKFLWDDDKECPEWLTAACMYAAENKLVEIEVRPWCTNDEAGMGVGNLFYGSEGLLVVGHYNNYAIYLGEKREPGPKGSFGDPMQSHVDNFVEAVLKRNPKLLNGPIETGHYASGIAHLCNISYRVGRSLEFDPQSEKFVNDPEADKLLTRDYRDGYVVPEVV